MELRWYQAEAVEAVWDHIRKRDDNPCIVIPTGGGKTPVIVQICKDAVGWEGRVLIMAHVKELLEQAASKLQVMASDIDFGVYSAGLKSRQTHNQVIIAGIQSVYNKAELLGHFNIIMIDECHLIPEESDGMYRSFLRDMKAINPEVCVIGLTATPFRTGTGELCGPDKMLNHICYEVGIKPLIAQKFLSPLTCKAGTHSINTDGVRVVRGEYDEDQLAERYDNVIEAACKEIYDKTRDRSSVLVFCQTVEHATRVREYITSFSAQGMIQAIGEYQPAVPHFGEWITLDHMRRGVAADWLEENGHSVFALRRHLAHGFEESALITGGTAAGIRSNLIDQFRNKQLKYLVNINVLTTGFDAPNVDCVCLLRSTVSPGLFYQMVGRGFRICEGKENCLVLDFGTNVKRHGTVDTVAKNARKKKEGGTEKKELGITCTNCAEVYAFTLPACPECGLIPNTDEEEDDTETVTEPAHDSVADETEIISGEAVTEVREVQRVEYAVHTKKNAPDTAPKTLRVTYHTGVAESVSEWICIEHEEGTFPHRKARTWWKARCKYSMPDTALEGVLYGQFHLLAAPKTISVVVTPGERFPEIVDMELHDKPTGFQPCKKCRSTTGNYVISEQGTTFPHAGSIICGDCNQFVQWASSALVDRFSTIEQTAKRGGEIRTIFGDAIQPQSTPSLYAALEETPNTPSDADDAVLEDFPF
jgi:DNA repair protein RadD